MGKDWRKLSACKGKTIKRFKSFDAWMNHAPAASQAYIRVCRFVIVLNDKICAYFYLHEIELEMARAKASRREEKDAKNIFDFTIMDFRLKVAALRALLLFCVCLARTHHK